MEVREWTNEGRTLQNSHVLSLVLERKPGIRGLGTIVKQGPVLGGYMLGLMLHCYTEIPNTV